MLRLGKTENYPSSVLHNEDVLKYKDSDMSVYRAIVEANKQHQDDTALIFMGKRISYKQLICQADRVAEPLQLVGPTFGVHITKSDLTFATVPFFFITILTLSYIAINSSKSQPIKLTAVPKK